MRLVLSLALVLAAASPALADDKAKAKALYQDGLNHYNLAEWTDAIKSWKEAYTISKKPLLLFNIGQAYRLSGDCKQAMTFYDTYQREEPNPKNQAELDEALALCAKQPDKPVEKPVGTGTTTTTTVPTKPDKPVVTPETHPTEVKPVVTPTVAQKPEPSEQQEPVDNGPQTTGGGLRKIGIGVGGAGVVLTGVGIFFGVKAKGVAHDLDGYTGEWGQTQIDQEQKGKHDQTMCIALTSVGVAALVAGGVMFAIGGPKATESGTVSLVPTSGGGIVGWSGSF